MGQSIRGNVALVTGAGRGIGHAIARALADEGCDVALLARNADELEDTARHYRASGVRALCLTADLTKTGAIEASVERCADTLGRLDILINNAGIFHWGSALEADPAAWDQLIDLNLRAAMRATRHALPYIACGEQGAVIFIASLAGKFAYGMNAAYVASKHGLVGFAGSVFEDVRERDIKVCAICPGLVSTAVTADIGIDPAKAIQPEDVAAAVRFVVTFPRSACPTEILLSPQRNPWSAHP